MAYIQVEASVRTHRKFLRAGPAASWLWLCGIGYCQDGLTDGFIPLEALDYLGVKDPAALVNELVKVGLWDAIDGGWQVHDYASHNRLAADISRLKDRRAAGGFLGGRPLKKPSPKPSRKTLNETLEGNHTENPSQIRSDHLNSSQINSPTDARVPFDAWFRELHGAYPEKSRSAGALTEHAFLAVFERDTRDPVLVFTDLKTALDNAKAGEQWAVKGMVPKLEKWLREGLYTQRHEPVESADAPARRDPYHWQNCPHEPKCGTLRECSELKAAARASA